VSPRLIKAVLLDSGDTLVDEATEIRDADGYVIEEALIPGALAMVQQLAAAGYRMALVADGLKRSFDTILGGHGIRQYLEAEIISEVLGCEKPDQRMFEAALAALGLRAGDAAQVVMIGNNLSRDINGANRAGMISIWLNWSPRREKFAREPDEMPDYTVKRPDDVPRLLAFIEAGLAASGY
jgi:HAD superfamily hydrolase (TIGR01549 family)